MKRTIIMLSGWAHPARALKPLAEHFLSRYEVILLSTMELTGGAVGLDALLRERGAPPLLLGWSLGGMMALELAAARPDRVAGLALIGSTPRFCDAPDFAAGTPERQVRALSFALQKNAIGALSQFLQDTAYPDRIAPQRLQARLEHALEFGTERLCRDLRYLRETDLRAACAGIRLPVLLLHGREDRVIPWEASDWLHRHLPDSTLRVIDRAGHNLPLAHPDRVLAETVEFAARCFP